MLLFSTILDINESMAKDDFIRLVIEWNQGSPHMSNIIPGIEWNGERNIRFGDDRLWLAIEEYRNQNIIAVRYEKQEGDGSVWDTDYVMNFTTMKMVVRLDRSYTQEALASGSRFSTPYFITLLMERGYLKKDGDLAVLQTPVIIDEDNLELVSEIINGNKRYKLPVVYISRTYCDEDPVNVRLLAGRLKGVAHVLVQKSNVTNPRLKKMCSDQNEYYGAIGIYYPNQALGHRRYLYRSSIGFDTFLSEKVVRDVIQYSNLQRIDSLYTWQGVNNAVLKDRLASQRADRLAAEAAQKRAEQEATHLLDTLDEEERRIRKQAFDDARSEANKILDSFDEDIARLQNQIEELTKTNEVLRLENQGLKAKLDSSDSVPVIYMGDEYEFYQGEVKDIILSVLSDDLSKIPQKSRRMDIIKDIIDSNDYQRINEKKADEIKRLLKNYSGMSGKLKKALIDLGFNIAEEGKHCKVTYYGDERYQTVFAKTPSDGRSGKNNAQVVIRMSF